MTRSLPLLCCYGLLLMLAYSPKSYGQSSDYCTDYDTSDGCSDNYICDAGSCVSSDYCTDYDTSDGCSDNYICDAGSCVSSDYCTDYDTSDGCSDNYFCEAGSCVSSNTCNDYDTSDGCSSKYICDAGSCVRNPADDYCEDYDTSDGCSSSYRCEAGTCKAIYTPSPSPSPRPSPILPPSPSPSPTNSPTPPPVPVDYPRPDSFAEISFTVSGATRDVFEASAFATTLSEFTGIRNDWIEVTISEESTDNGLAARRRSFRRRRQLLRSLFQDASTSGLVVDSKLYTDQVQETLEKVKTAVQTGQVQQKLAVANNKISSVAINTASSSSSSSSDLGAIVGGVLGGIAAVAVVAGGFAVWHSRRRQKRVITVAEPPAFIFETVTIPATVPHVVVQQNPNASVALNPPTLPSLTSITSTSSAERTSSSQRKSKKSGFNFRKFPPPPTLPPAALPVDPFMSWVTEQLASNPVRPSILNGPYEVLFSQLQVERPIGEGSFGRVYAGKLNNAPVAIKVLLEASSGRMNDPLVANSAITASSPIMVKLHEEVKIMSSMDHPHVVKFIGVCSMPPCIVTELCSQGSLSDVIKAAASSPEAASQLSWRRRLAMAIDAAEGMRYLHSQTPPIIHRDLKSANMLVTDDFRVKISDFNLSKILDDSTRSSSIAAMNPRWLAPELFAGARGSPPCDVFAFGVVLWELLTLDVPWGNTNPWQIVSTVQNGGRLPIPARDQLQAAAPMTAACYAGFVRLIAKCWAQMPEERPEIRRVSEELRVLAAGDV